MTYFCKIRRIWWKACASCIPLHPMVSSISSDNTLLHRLSIAITVLKMATESQDTTFCCCRSSNWWACTSRNTAALIDHYFKSQQRYLKCSYIIQLIAFQWDTACTHTSPDLSEVSLACESTYHSLSPVSSGVWAQHYFRTDSCVLVISWSIQHRNSFSRAQPSPLPMI